jgi:hypothetical protein
MLNRRFNRIKHIDIEFPSCGTWRVPADAFIDLILKEQGIENTEDRKELFMNRNLLLKEAIKKFTWADICHLATHIVNPDCIIGEEWPEAKIVIKTEVVGFEKPVSSSIFKAPK